MATRNSSAYDFAMFESKPREVRAPEKKPNVIELPQERLEENRKPKHRWGRIIPSALAFVTIAGMVSVLICGQVQLTELTESLNAANKNLSESQNEYTQLQMKSDSQLSLETIENYASQKLGMKKVDQSQVSTIQLSNGDKTQVVLKEDNNWLEKLWGSIRQFLS